MLGFETAATDTFLDRERERLKAHFDWVVEVLRVQPTTGLSDEALVSRQLLIETLSHYARRGIFPCNPLRDRMVPTFVDSGGRECAVAHLLLATGDAPLVEAVRAKKNLAHVAEMVGPELEVWAEFHGLTLAELAFIQPDYCPPSDFCSHWSIADGCNPQQTSCECTVTRLPDGYECPPLEKHCLRHECQAGTCYSTQEAIDCDDDDPDTFDSCDPRSGCMSTKRPLLPEEGGGQGTGETEERDAQGCSHANGLPDGSLAPVLAGLFLIAMRRRGRARGPRFTASE
ncbi:MAG: hypothetical protein HOV80_15755 [Polyangiaceae bacterium]|nr:hypothetical protein [Polyangiaceae bacterium]